MDSTPEHLPDSELLELKRWNTPTIYNGWEQITRHDTGRDAVNLEPVYDYMPQMGAMVGYAVTVVCEPGNPDHKRNKAEAVAGYREYVGSVPGPKIVVVQDLDKPQVLGAFWGEVNANVHLALGCVGTIVDGAIRDVDDMTAAGFKALARCLCVGHAHSTPVRWNCPVEVFGRTIEPGQLVHADKHGFLAVPFGDEKGLLDASRFMDSNECQTVIAAARDHHGKSATDVCEALKKAGAAYNAAARNKFSRKGEW